VNTPPARRSDLFAPLIRQKVAKRPWCLRRRKTPVVVTNSLVAPQPPTRGSYARLRTVNVMIMTMCVRSLPRSSVASRPEAARL